MENFFYNDNFHMDLDSLMDDLDLNDEKNVFELEDDWMVPIELTKLEPIIQYDKESLINAIVDCIDEERLSEDGDELNNIRMSINERLFIDIDKLNKSIPRLYYITGERVFVTKQDLIEYMK